MSERREKENRLKGVVNHSKNENRIRLAHFLAVAVIQSNRSPPSLRIQDEYGSLLTVCFEENTKHMRTFSAFLETTKVQARGEVINVEAHRECMEKVPFRSLREKPVSHCLLPR